MTIFGHLPPDSLLAWERNWQVPSISPNTSVSSWPCSLTARSADSGFTIPTTSKWTCCTRHPTPVKWRHWSCLEMRQTGVWQEQSGGGSKAELQGHDFSSSQACCPTHSKSAEHHSESKKWKAGPPHKAGEETSPNGWGLRAHEPQSHCLALPSPNSSPYGPFPSPPPFSPMENDCHSSSRIHLHCCLLLLHPSKP